MTYTEDEVNELKLCKEDIIYFAEKYIKINSPDNGEALIKLYPKQKDILLAWVNDTHHVTLSSRQSGISTLYAIFLLHTSLFNIDRTSVICCNKQDNCIHMRNLVKSIYDNLSEFLQSELITDSNNVLFFINGSRIKFTTFKYEQLGGIGIHNLIMDNIDYVPIETFNEIVKAIVPIMSSRKSSKLIIGGTPKYSESKQLELAKTRGWNTTTITYKDVPHQNTSEWELPMRRLIGDDVFNDEFALEYAT